MALHSGKPRASHSQGPACAVRNTVPLSEPLIALLEGLPRITGSSLLFPGTRNGRLISNMAMLMTLRRLDQKDLDDGGKGWRDSNEAMKQ